MALVYFDDDPWIAAHDACEKLYRDIQSQLVMWSGVPRSSATYGSSSATIRQKLKQYSAEINQLRQQLSKTTSEQMITDAESERRSRQIEVLQSRYLQLQNEFNNGVQTSTSRGGAFDLNQAKQELFGDSYGRPTITTTRDREFKDVSSANWGTGSDDDEELLGGEMRNPSVHDVRKHQYQMIKDQDRGLDELSKIIARQKDIAENIGNEVAVQNEIIDDLADHIDRTDGHIQSETGQIRIVDRKDSTCRYWTIIIILFTAIIIVAVV